MPFGVLALAFLSACSPTRRVLDVTEVDHRPAVVSDSLASEVRRARITYVQPERPTPDVAPDRSVDLLDTKLDLRFDFARRAVLGTAEHRVASLRDGLASFTLHAVGMEIHGVESRSAGPVAFDYDGRRLTITPDRPLDLGDTLVVAIDYTAHPMDTSGQSGLAFSGYGLYFIDPDGTDPHRPTQLWTQGQTEDSRRWFPTWDYPNDRMTFEIALTVPDSMQTFANGERVASEPMGEGLHRDVWRLDAYPQPAYLAAFVAGDFAVVEDEYVREDSSVVPLRYVVEPAYADDAMRIFGETPAMMAAFEAETGVPYVWPNYKQAAVRDFTAGGMENTTLTILTPRIQTDPRGYLDYDGRDLIAHELSHHWFGDLAGAEDWANLAVNESFASYLEERYLERAFGGDAAQAHGIADREAYFAQAEALRRPIVWYGYEREGQMFDTHTYQKGGQVLNQLRFELGEAVWRRALALYLTEHAGEATEMDDVREAFETASGRSLRRFFDQWFFQPGHPALDVEQAFFPGSDLYTLQVTQTQNLAAEPLFHFDVNVELNYPSAPRELRRLRITSADTTFRFSVPEKPTFVRFDEGNWLLADVRLTQATDELAAMARTDDEMAGRYDAVVALAALPESPAVRQALVDALRDDQPLVRRRAAEALARYLRAPGVPEALARLARDPDPRVRAATLDVLAGTKNVGLLDGALRGALGDSSYVVTATAVELYARRFPERAYAAFEAEGLFDVRSAQGRVEQALIRAIDSLDAEAGGPYLIERAGPDHPDAVREAAVAALTPLALSHAALRAPAREFYRTLLEDRLAAVRLAAVRGLGRFGTEEDIARLEVRLDAEPEAEVREAIRVALRQIRGRQTGTQIER